MEGTGMRSNGVSQRGMANRGGVAELEEVGVRQEEDLIRHLRAVTGLDAGVLEKILAEVKAWYGEEMRAWIVRRHRELQAQGLTNREIYAAIRQEAGGILVRPAPLSERQIRRAIYG
jgi:hypothetical protein